MGQEEKKTKRRRRGRPKKEGKRYVFRLTLTLWEGEDDDLIAFFEALQPGQRAPALKQALRAGGITLQDAVEDDDDDLDLDAFLI